MALQGVVSVVADMQARAAVGPIWAQAVKALSPRVSFVRGSISADRQGNVDVKLLRHGLQSFANVGLAVHAVIEANLGTPGLNPNDHLGYQGDHLKNAWIESQTQHTIALLRALGPLCPPVLFWLNEPNSQAALNPLGSGKVIPVLAVGDAADPLKPEAMSPEVYFASLYHAAYWIRRQVPAVKAIYPAALSCFVAFKTSLQDDWIGNYWGTGIQYLTDRKLAPPWPFSNVCLNLEGLVDQPYAQYVSVHSGNILRNTGTTGGLICPEWGVPGSSPGKPVNIDAMTAAARAIDTIADAMSFFSFHPSGGYGCLKSLSYANGEILPGVVSDWMVYLPIILDGLPGGTP